MLQADFFTTTSCHCIQTTTEVLAKTLRQFHPYVAVFSNQAGMLAPPRKWQPAQHAFSPVTILFGALNRRADSAPLMPALNVS
jgi:hypothetical protein